MVHSHGVHENDKSHGHTHGTVDPSLLTSERGIWALKWSFVGLFITALFQVAIVYYTGSVALLADTIHNFGDAATAVPLWIAFSMVRRKSSPWFTYGYGRVEDLAGVVIVLVILFSAIFAGYEAIQRLLHPQPVTNLWAVVIASIVGFAGNEFVALFRIKVGKEINSAALIADGYHARVDGLTSLGVLAGVIGVWLGFPLADPIVGLLITVTILGIVWDSSKAVFIRLLDGVDPKIVDEIRHSASHLEEVVEVTEVRARWLGHRLHAEVNLAVSPQLTVSQAHDVSVQAHNEILRHIPYLSSATIHVDPDHASGEIHHKHTADKHQGGEHDHAHPPIITLIEGKLKI